MGATRPTNNWLDDGWSISIEPCNPEELNYEPGHLCEAAAERDCTNVAVVVVRLTMTEDGESWFVCLDCAVAVVKHDLTDPEMAPNGWSGQPWCRECGCSENDCSECIERRGFPCAWVEPSTVLANLCTACVP